MELLFPKQVKCVTCGNETNKFGICDKCIKEFSFIKGNTCEICGIDISDKNNVCYECKGREYSFDKNFAIFHYSGDVRDKIISFKQSRVKSIGEMFAYFIADKYEEISKYFDIDLIVPMPISSERLKTRKFNQSEILCNELKYTGKVRNDILLRVKDTPHQTGLSREHRKSNLEGAFKVTDKKLIRNKIILIVDDIYTTGSTLNECAKTLKKAGVKRVLTLTFARTPIKLDRIIKSTITKKGEKLKKTPDVNFVAFE